MSTIDLIILGILSGRPMNAYELTNFVAEWEVNRLLKISTPAIYKSCKRLYKLGFLSRKLVKEGEQPEKAIYSLNKKGKERFFSLMTHFSSDVKPFFLDFNAFLWNIEVIDKKQGLQMLTTLQNELANLKTWIIQHEKQDLANASFAAKAIVKQYRMMISTLFSWSEETIREFKKIKKMR